LEAAKSAPEASDGRSSSPDTQRSEDQPTGSEKTASTDKTEVAKEGDIALAGSADDSSSGSETPEGEIGAGVASASSNEIAGGRAGDEVRPLGERLMVDGRPLRERLDPAGAAAWSQEFGDEVLDPTDRLGNRIADTESNNPERDKKSRAEAFRNAFRRDGEKVADKAGQATSKLQDLMTRRPPTGHQEVRTGSEMSPIPHQGLDAGNVLTTALATTALIGEGVRFARRKIKERKG
jgi:hypothetical protein